MHEIRSQAQMLHYVSRKRHPLRANILRKISVLVLGQVMVTQKIWQAIRLCAIGLVRLCSYACIQA